MQDLRLSLVSRATLDRAYFPTSSFVPHGLGIKSAIHIAHSYNFLTHTYTLASAATAVTDLLQFSPAS